MDLVRCSCQNSSVIGICFVHSAESSTMQAQTHSTNNPGYERRWLGLVFIGISLIVISLDNTILNVAIPSISRTLGANASELQWIIDAYVLVFAALLLTMGGLGDRFGRKRALQVGLVLFGLGSLAAALSPSTGVLIAARAFLGIGGATIMPATLSIISATFPSNERPRAIATWAAVFGLGVGIGPLIGGFLLQHFEWNSVFLVNLPVIVVALIGGAYTLGESRDEHAPKADFPGVILSILGLFALLYGIIEAGLLGWTNSTVLTAFAFAAVLLGAFAWWENRNPDAMLPMHFFRNMSFTGANLALAFVTFSLFGATFFMSQYLQTILGYSTLEAGVAGLPLALMLTFVASRSAFVAARLGNKYTVALGISIAGLGLLFMSVMFHHNTTIFVVVIGQLILATGMGLAVSPATNSIMASVPISKAGIGSAMNDTTRQLGGAVGVAVLGTIMNNYYMQGISTLKTALPQLPAEVHEAISSSIQAAHIVANNPQVPAEARDLIISTSNQAFVTGMNSAMLIGALVMAGAAVLALVLLPAEAKRMQDEHEIRVEDANASAVPATSGD
jgi:EmrB/QacA subfamily drug resistance transporter